VARLAGRPEIRRLGSVALAVVLGLVGIPQAARARAQHPQASPLSSIEEFPIPLPVGQRTQAQLSGEQIHAYLADLREGQYVSIRLHRPGAELHVVVRSPHGDTVLEYQSLQNSWWDDRISLIASETGLHRFEVRLRFPAPDPLNYELELLVLREATPLDSKSVAAERLVAEGNALREQRRIEPMRSAIVKLDAARALFHEVDDPVAEAMAMTFMGSTLMRLGETQRALELHPRALALFRKADDRQGEMMAVFNLGLLTQTSGRWIDAIRYLEEALGICRSIPDPYGEVRILNAMAILQMASGDRQKVIDGLARAMALSNEHNFRQGRAETLANYGALHGASSPEQALSEWTEAARFYREIKEPTGEVDALTGLGRLRMNLGEAGRALEALSEALRLSQETGDKQGEFLARTSLGSVYATLGQPEDALTDFQEALALARSRQDKGQEVGALLGLGVVYGEYLKRKEESIKCFQEILERPVAIGNPFLEAMMINNIGRVHQLSGEPGRALELFEASLACQREKGTTPLEFVTLTDMGEVYSGWGDVSTARDLYRQALTSASAARSAAWQAKILYRLSELDAEEGDLEKALPPIRAAIEMTESIRASAPSSELRSAYFASVGERYTFYVDLLARLDRYAPSSGFDVRAFQVAESAKARGLFELIQESRIDVRSSADPGLLDREFQLRQALGQKSAARVVSAASGRPAAGDEAEVDALRRSLERLQAEIRSASPAYASLKLPSAADVPRIQRELGASDTLLLEYCLADPRSYVFVVTGDQVRVVPLGTKAAMEAAARQVYEGSSRSGRPAAPEPGPEAQQLADMVLGPVADFLGGHRRIVVVPDGALSFVPLGSLPSPNGRGGSLGRRMIVDHEVVYLPSASVLSALRERSAARPPTDRSVAVLADPVFTREDPRLPSGAQARADRVVSGPATPVSGPERELEGVTRDIGPDASGSPLPRLPFTRQEARAILGLAPAGQRLEALDFKASKTTATGPELARYRYVHFATHALVDSVRPELSGVVLSLLNEQGIRQDGFLSTVDIFNLRIPADLVVLSACRTGLGKELRGEGLVGLTRAFMYAGAPRVVASLWRVDDSASAELMKRFYEAMLGQKRLPPAAALRDAQLWMMKQPRWHDPYFWAGFILQGEWN
jgi:CHAT domain-containing protein/Tfp pilus assembly protein PilF